MAKLKEIPSLILNFSKNLIKGDYKTIKKQMNDTFIYYAEKNLSGQNPIRYEIWKKRHKARVFELKNENTKFAVVYFYEKEFCKKTYASFKKSLNEQCYDSFELYLSTETELKEKITNDKCTHICFVEQGDLYKYTALNNIAKLIETKPDLEIIYTDEDVICPLTKSRFNPYFKTSFLKYILFSHNYLNALLCLKSNDFIFDNISDLDQNKLYKLILEYTREPKKTDMLLDTLYHRSYANYKKNKNTSSKKIVQDELSFRNINAKIVDYKVKGINKLQFIPNIEPKVSIIIPFKDKINLLKNCIKSIEEKSTYKNYEIILVNNRSSEEASFKYLEKTPHKVIDADIDFNFSKLNNMAAKEANGEYLILMNNDMTIISPSWIENMLGLASLDDVGQVGTKLVYPNNKLQHTGVFIATHQANRFLNKNADGYMHYCNIPREYISLSGACFMVSKEKYWKVNGLTEELAVEGNDYDFSLKLWSKGYKNIYCPDAMLYHYEAMTRKRKHKESRSKEVQQFLKTWLDLITKEPCFSKNLSNKRCDFAIKITNERNINWPLNN